MKKYLLISTDEFGEVFDTCVVHTSSLRKAFREVYYLGSKAYTCLYLVTFRNHHLISVGESFYNDCCFIRRPLKTDVKFVSRDMPDGTRRLFVEEV